MNKGFITVATGHERYYKMAHNLLLSYRFHSKTPVPFAILCDQRNKWTTDFDEVVIIDNPACTFLDKLRILDLSPYDNTIFIDSDCLVFKDLNDLWTLFQNGPDVGVLGDVFPLDSEKGWWDAKNLGDLRDKVDYKLICQGGMYYVRKKGKKLPAFIDSCLFIQDHYLDYHFSIFETKLEDETILSLASAVHHFLPVKKWQDVFAYYQEATILRIDILSGVLEYKWNLEPDVLRNNAFFLHFGTSYVMNRWQYKKEVFKLKNGAIRLSNYGKYCILRINHARMKVLATCLRWLGRNGVSVLDIYS